jgi:predicted SAM-dependent methyltransferase
MPSAVKASSKTCHCDGLVGGLYKTLYGTFRRFRRRIAGVDKNLVKQYFGQQRTRKLHLGSGGHTIDGWLNSDLFPASRHVLHMDATTTYPFDDETFDYVFSEHMIEHVSYEKGQRMIQESFRVLKVGGRIRISTPDLAFLIALYQGEKSELQKRYIRYEVETEGLPYCEDTFVINDFVRNWGHTFIYDEKVLRVSLEKVGFQEITRCDLNASEDEVLRNLENEKKIPEGFLRLESLTLEGTKKAAATFR